MVVKRNKNSSKLHLGLLIGGIASCTLIGGVGLGFGIYNFVQSSKKQYRVGDSFTINKTNAKYMYNYADNKLAPYKQVLEIIAEESTSDIGVLNDGYVLQNLINEDDLNFQLGNNFGEKFVYWELMASLADGIRNGLVESDYLPPQPVDGGLDGDYREIYKMHSISIDFLSDDWCVSSVKNIDAWSISESLFTRDAYAWLNNLHVKINCDTINNRGSIMKNQHLDEIYIDADSPNPLMWSYDSWNDRFIVSIGIDEVGQRKGSGIGMASYTMAINLTSQIARGYQHFNYDLLEPYFGGATVYIMSPKAGEYYEQYAKNNLQIYSPPSTNLTINAANAYLSGDVIYYDLLAWLADNVADGSIPNAGGHLQLYSDELNDENEYSLDMSFRYLNAAGDVVYHEYDDQYTFSYVWDTTKTHWYLHIDSGEGESQSFRSAFLANAGYSGS